MLMSSLLLLAAPLAPPVASFVVDHKAVNCVVAGKHPSFVARAAGGVDVASARVYFQGKGRDWYSVAMKSEGADLSAALPSPKKELSEFHYYIEMTSRGVETARTPDITARVVGAAAECGQGVVATVVSAASILVQGPAGVAALPSGFANAGLVAAGAGGGISATTVAVVGAAVGGGALAATQLGVVGGGTDYLGQINATYTLDFGGCRRTTRFTGTLALTLKGDGGEASSDNGRYETLSSACPNGPQAGNVLNGGFPVGAITKSGDSISYSASEVSGGNTFEASFKGTLSGDTITGAFTYTERISPAVGGYTVTVTLTKR